MPEEQLVKVIGDYDGLVVRSATKVIYYNKYILIYNIHLVLQGDPRSVETRQENESGWSRWSWR